MSYRRLPRIPRLRGRRQVVTALSVPCIPHVRIRRRANSRYRLADQGQPGARSKELATQGYLLIRILPLENLATRVTHFLSSGQLATREPTLTVLREIYDTLFITG